MSALYQFPFPDWSDWGIIEFIVIVIVLGGLFILVMIAAFAYKDENVWNMTRQPSWMKRAFRRTLQVLGKKSDSPSVVTDSPNDQHFNFTELKKHVERIERKLDDQKVLDKVDIKIIVREQLLDLLRNDAGIRKLLEPRQGETPLAQDSARYAGQGGSTTTRSAQLGGSTDVHKNTSGRHAGTPGASSRKYLEIRDLYNDSLADQGRRIEFRERFHPVTISVVNAVDRRRDQNLAPVYQTSSDGNFLAVSLGSGGEYAVFPNFGVALEESSHGEGAMGEVFPCSEFDRRYNYPNIRVEIPAIFVKKGDGGWELSTEGVLNLGQPQGV
jgi:hypothetical protein